MLGCSADSNTISSEVPFYQDYKVTYNKSNNTLKAQATFRISNDEGKRLELKSPAKILCNGKTSPWTRLDNYFYNWDFKGKVDAKFVLTNNKEQTIENKILSSEINDVAIPDSFKTVKLNESTVFTWQGEALKENEYLRVELSQGTETSSLLSTDKLGAKSIEITKGALSTLKPGEATFMVYRELTKDVEVKDASAGGRRVIAVTTEKKITIQ